MEFPTLAANYFDTVNTKHFSLVYGIGLAGVLLILVFFILRSLRVRAVQTMKTYREDLKALNAMSVEDAGKKMELLLSNDSIHASEPAQNAENRFDSVTNAFFSKYKSVSVMGGSTWVDADAVKPSKFPGLFVIGGGNENGQAVLNPRTGEIAETSASELPSFSHKSVYHYLLAALKSFED